MAFHSILVLSAFRKPGLRSRIVLAWVVAFVVVFHSGLGAAEVETKPSSNKPPNIVLIVADDLGWADLGCYGSRFHRTERLDRLAALGRRFDQAYAACCVCSPTRAALMTGKYPSRLAITDWLPGNPDRPTRRLLRGQLAQGLSLAETTLAERLQAAGYATAHIGKWHLGGEGFEPTRQGFDLNIAGDANGSPVSYFAPFARGDYSPPGLSDAPVGEYLTDRLTSECEKFIACRDERPFFLYVPHFAVHLPLVAQKERQAKYPAWDGVDRGQQQNPIYAAMLESLDDGVGRILDALERAQLAEQTIVIFTSDNGGLATREGPDTPATCNAPLREGKGWLYEGGIRVPLLIHWPGHISPGVDSQPVWTGDLLPTILALVGMRARANLDGVSLAGALLSDSKLAPRSLFWHYPHYCNQGGRPASAIRDGDWKMLRFHETGRRELFDLAKDMGENRNLSEEQPAKLAELTEKLQAWLTEVGAPAPKPNPDFRPIAADRDGVIVLPASEADVHGVMLRYEPAPHKDTLGYWVRADDWADWEFEVSRPGRYSLSALLGCGTGSGGSKVEFHLDEQVLSFVVPETGGFQKFEARELGHVEFSRSGRYRLEVRVNEKPGLAVMDLREVRLRSSDAR